MMRRWAVSGVLGMVVLAAWAQPVWADSDSIATLGLSGRLAWQNTGETIQSGQDYTLHGGVRAKLLYVLGAEFEISQVPTLLQDDLYRPSMRLTAQIHPVNTRYVDFYLGAGLASSTWDGLVDFKGERTLYRLGGGFEVILDGHWALGLDGYWNLPSAGAYKADLEAFEADLKAQASAPPSGTLQTAQDASLPSFEPPRYDTSNFEVGFAIRYFF